MKWNAGNPLSPDESKRFSRVEAVALKKIEALSNTKREAYGLPPKPEDPQTSFMVRFRTVFSPYDILWLILATGTAWKLGSGDERWPTRG